MWFISKASSKAMKIRPLIPSHVSTIWCPATALSAHASQSWQMLTGGSHENHRSLFNVASGWFQQTGMGCHIKCDNGWSLDAKNDSFICIVITVDVYIYIHILCKIIILIIYIYNNCVLNCVIIIHYDSHRFRRARHFKRVALDLELLSATAICVLL